MFIVGLLAFLASVAVLLFLIYIHDFLIISTYFNVQVLMHWPYTCL